MVWTDHSASAQKTREQEAWTDRSASAHEAGKELFLPSFFLGVFATIFYAVASFSTRK